MSNCYHCMLPIPDPEPNACTPGYGTDKAGHRICYQCCAWLELIDLINGQPVALYVHTDGTVTNWTGHMPTMRVTRSHTGRHNMAGKVTTHYFRGPLGAFYSGREYHGPCSGSLLRCVRRLVRHGA